MTILFAGCADDKGEPNIIYEKDDNTDTGTDIPENITYNITVTSVSNIDKTDNTSAWRFEPYSADDALEAVFADILGRPDSESDKTMIADINSSHLEGEYYKDAFGSGYYGNTYLNVMFRSSDYVDYGDAIYTRDGKIYTRVHGSKHIVEEKLAESVEKLFEQVYDN